MEVDLTLLPSKAQINSFARYSHAKQAKKIEQVALRNLEAERYANQTTEEKIETLDRTIREIRNMSNSVSTRFFIASGTFLILSIFTLWRFLAFAVGIMPFAQDFFISSFVAIIFLIFIALLLFSYTNLLKVRVFPVLGLEEFYLREKRKLERAYRLESEDLLNKKRDEAEKKLEEAKSKAQRKGAEVASKRKEILLNKGRSINLFKEYAQMVREVIDLVSPGEDYLAFESDKAEVASGLSIENGGVGLPGYTPSHHPEWQGLLDFIANERQALQDMADKIRLPVTALNLYQELSRTYYGSQREGGSSTIYDEQMITNEVMAMKESLTVSGDYHDKSVNIDHSTSQHTYVASAIVDTGEYSEERVRKEIIKAALNSPDEAISRIELISIIPVSESEISQCLERLQLSAQLKIINRESGEVAYQIDRLA